MRAKRTDGNHAEIVAALRACTPPCLVQSLAMVGCGVPDLLVFSPAHRAWMLLEVKDGSLPPSARALTGAEKSWHKLCSAHGAPVYTVSSAADAVKIVSGDPKP